MIEGERAYLCLADHGLDLLAQGLHLLEQVLRILPPVQRAATKRGKLSTPTDIRQRFR